MRKIIIFASDSKTVINFRLHLIKNLLNLGLSVVVVAPLSVNQKNAGEILNKLGVKFINLNLQNTSLNAFKDLIVFKEILKIIKIERPDFIFAYTIKPVIYGSIVAKICGISSNFSLITGLGYIFIGNSFKIKLLRFLTEKLYKFALKFSSKVFFQNIDDLSLFVSKNIVDKSKSVLINGSGVDLAHYIIMPYPEKITFLFVGRLIRDKGINEYIEACKILQRSYPKIEFKIVGSCDANPASITSVELNDLIDNGIIKYLGYVNDVRLSLKDASVLVLPSYREGTSRAVLEAMATGRPIITTDAPGCRETVIDGLNGYLVPVKNVDKLVEAMKQFILFPDYIESMGKESRKLAEEKYNVDTVNRVILSNMGIIK